MHRFLSSSGRASGVRCSRSRPRPRTPRCASSRASPSGARSRRSSAASSSTSSVATNALQDPHQIQAKPSLIARARNADLVACTGAELEIGWLPVLLQQSGNAKVQPGQPGNFAAADFVRKLEVPTQLDRSQGDVHAAGNPHIQTDPRNIALVATALAARLPQIDPANAAQYAKNRGRIRAEVAAGDRALDSAGGAAARHRRRRRSTRRSSTSTTGSA